MCGFTAAASRASASWGAKGYGGEGWGCVAASGLGRRRDGGNEGRWDGFFYFDLFLIEMNRAKSFFLNLVLFDSRQFVWLWDHINTYDVTHFYVDIVCHINLLIGLITYFDIENESRHFEFKWRDYESRHPFVRDSF
jgi:hypothetical protein